MLLSCDPERPIDGRKSALMDEQQQRRGREGSKSPAPARPARAGDAVIGTTLEPEWPYSANPSSPARSAGIERRSRCRPTPASSSTSARAAANACDLGAAIAACSALSGTCRARRSRAPADRVALKTTASQRRHSIVCLAHRKFRGEGFAGRWSRTICVTGRVFDRSTRQRRSLVLRNTRACRVGRNERA